MVATGDFNGDGMGDILWQDTSGNLAVWLMNGATPISTAGARQRYRPRYSVAGAGDFNGDRKSDILWRDTSGNMAIWFMNGTQIASVAGIGNVPAPWSIAGTGDLDGNGMSDIIWQDTSGNTAVWLMNGASIAAASGLGTIPTTWSIAETGDFDGNGTSDLLVARYRRQHRHLVHERGVDRFDRVHRHGPDDVDTADAQRRLTAQGAREAPRSRSTDRRARAPAVV